MSIFPPRHRDAVNAKQLGKFGNFHKNLLAKKSNLCTRMKSRFHNDTFPDALHYLGSPGNRNNFLTAFLAPQDIHIDQMDIIEPAFQKMMMPLF
jgi:hypothetical protein